MLNKTSEYALRAVVVLARKGKPTTAQTLAEAAAVPVGYMAKVLNVLARNGLIGSRRGPQGGFTLARDPGSLTMLDVIHALEGTPRAAADSDHDHPGPQAPQDPLVLAPLVAKLRELTHTTEDTLAHTTILDLIEDGPARHVAG